jgi:hypothetical protein
MKVHVILEAGLPEGVLLEVGRGRGRARGGARAAGLDEVALRLHDQPQEGLRLIGEQSMPALGWTAGD